MEGLRAAIVSVGDELLLGQTVDTNSAWLADRLSQLGLPVIEQRSVGDEDARIRAAVSAAGEEAALVLITGGLGPTADDRTVPAVASQRGVLPDALGVPVHNPLGTAPGRWVAPDGAAPALLLMPGVPREMKAVFEQAEPLIRRAFGDRLLPVHVRSFATTGIPESKLAPDLQPVIDSIAGVGLAFLPDLDGVALRLTVTNRSEAEATRLLDLAEAGIAPFVERWRLHSVSGDVVESLADALTTRGWALALGESCTGGEIGSRITAREGASTHFLGGVVAYSNAAKQDLLGVPEDLIARHGAVSEEVAVAMAEGAMRAFAADCGIGITGIAGPGGGSEEKPVGTVCFAAVTPRGSAVTTQQFRGDREGVRRRSGQAAMVQLLRLVEEGS